MIMLCFFTTIETLKKSFANTNPSTGMLIASQKMNEIIWW